MRPKMVRAIITTLSFLIATAVSAEQHFAGQRERMIQAIQSMATLVPSQETAASTRGLTKISPLGLRSLAADGGKKGRNDKRGR
jgi:hypothetical protein